MTPIEYFNSLFWPKNLDSLHSGQVSVGPVTYNATISDITKTGQFASFIDYVKLIVDLLLIPPLAIAKGCYWLFGKKIRYYGEVDIDFDMGGEKKNVDTVSGVFYRLKTDSPKEDIKRNSIHSIVFIIAGLLSLAVWSYAAYGAKKLKEFNTAWHSISATDEYTGETLSYDVVYPTVNSNDTKTVMLMRNEGKYYLLSSSYAYFDVDHSKKSCSVNIISDDGVEPAEFGILDDSWRIRSHLGKENQYAVCFVIPSEVIPSQGLFRIQSKGKVYSFNLN